MNGEAQIGRGAVTLKHWQLVLVVAVQLGSIGAAYGRMSQRMDDSERRQQQMESVQPITQNEFREYQQEMRDRMQKIDADLREIIRLEHTK
jgi:hypothetical protein